MTHDTNEPAALTEVELATIQARANNLRMVMQAGQLGVMSRTDLHAVARGYDADVLPLLADNRRLRAVVARQEQQIAAARAALQRMVDRNPFRRTDCSGYRVCDYCYADEGDPHVFGCQWVADRALLATLGPDGQATADTTAESPQGGKGATDE